MADPISLRAVARRLGISATAVSLVARNPRTTRVGADLAEAIMRALGRPPGGGARLGIALPESWADDNGEFFLHVLSALQLAAGRQELVLTIATTAWWRSAANRRQVDGLLALTAAGIVSRSTLPTVVIGDRAPGFDAVLADHQAAMIMAVRALHELGHRRIAYLVFADDPHAHQPMIERLAGWRAGMHACGLRDDPDLACLVPEHDPSVLGPGTMHAVARRWRGDQRRPTAAIVFNDQVAEAFLRACSDVGLRCPQDLSLIGFDDSPLARTAQPPLASVGIDYADLARITIQRLLVRIGEPVKGAEVIRVGCRLVMRASVARCAEAG